MGNKRGRQGAELALVYLHAVRSSEKDLDTIFRELGFSMQSGMTYLEISACSKCHTKKLFLNGCQKGTNVAQNPQQSARDPGEHKGADNLHNTPHLPC